MNNVMKLSITHISSYTYDTPVHYALQQLRLTPRSGKGQNVLNWESEISGGTKQLSFDDAFVNLTELVKVDRGGTRIDITSRGLVEVEDCAGVVGDHVGFTPLWLFQQHTALTAPGNNVRQLAARVRDETTTLDDMGRLHQLSAEILEAVAYETGRTDSGTTAEVAITAGQGVCQDHAHIMIAAARQIGYPARYVSGYLFMDGQEVQNATHAWCEVWTEGLGWVGFDVSNGISPDSRYVRIATGRDYHDAAPILGIRQGAGEEQLQVSLQVQQ